MLKNRLIWLAITNSPYVCNTFAGPKLGETFLRYSTWRWGYGSFAIITPFMCIPFWAIFWLMTRKAERNGVIERAKSGRTAVQSIMHWCIEFDRKSFIYLHFDTNAANGFDLYNRGLTVILQVLTFQYSAWPAAHLRRLLRLPFAI